jgi:hypothetical protein
MKAITRNLLKWEFRWIVVEMAMVGLGLLLQFTPRWDALGSLVLFLALAVSFIVRSRHYGRCQIRPSSSKRRLLISAFNRRL